MKWLVLVGALAAGYCYFLLHTTDQLVTSVMQLNQTYQYVGQHANDIVGMPHSSL